MNDIIKDKNFILASKSSRRKEILEKAGLSFDIYVPKGEELDIIGKKYSDTLVINCCKNKAENAYNELLTIGKIKKLSHPIIISCDTVVVNDNIIIGKPKNRDDAINILKSLSNKTHFVSSGICIVENGKYNTIIEKTFITFKTLSEKEIIDYIDNYKPFDKAGSYGIQDEGFDFVKKADGNIDNVIGLPMQSLKVLLSK